MLKFVAIKLFVVAVVVLVAAEIFTAARVAFVVVIESVIILGVDDIVVVSDVVYVIGYIFILLPIAFDVDDIIAITIVFPGTVDALEATVVVVVVLEMLVLAKILPNLL